MSRFADRIDARALTTQEVRTLLRAIGANPDHPVPLSEAIMLVHWCDAALHQAALVEGVLLGHLSIRWPEREAQPRFQLTHQGHSYRQQFQADQ